MPKCRSTFIVISLLLLVLVLGACSAAEAEPTPTPVAPSTPADAPIQPGATEAEEEDLEGSNAEGAETTTAEGETGTDTGENGTTAGAVGETPSVPAEQATPQLAGTLVLWHSWAGAEGDALAAILQDFSGRYPGVQVDTLFVAHDDLLQAYAESVIAEGGPDLLLAPNWWLGEMVFLQLLTPFGPELAQATTDQVFPAALQSMTWQETLYGIPVHVTVPAVFINTDLYNGSAPQTLSEWRELAAASPNQGIGLYANLYHLAWGLTAHDVQLFDAAGSVVLDQSPGTVDFLNWLNEVNQLEGSYVDQDYGMLLDRFQKGEFAFFVDGPWSYSDLSGILGGAVRVEPLPAGPAGPAMPWLYAEGLFLNPNTDDATRRLAVTFAQHLTASGAAEILADTGNLLPANRTVDLPPDHHFAGFHAQANSAQAMPIRSEMDTVWGYGGDMILRALLSYPDLEGDELAAALSAMVGETTTLINEANGR